MAILVAMMGGVAAHAAEPPMHVLVVNRSGVALDCQALAGHWYGFDLGRLAPGAQAAFAFGLDPGSRVVSLPNPAHVPVPIATVYCGAEGEAWRTRAELPLRALAEAAAAQGGALRVVCRRDGAAALHCDRTASPTPGIHSGSVATSRTSIAIGRGD